MKVFLWPDGTYCTEDEIEEYLTFMSDDHCELIVPEDMELDSYMDIILTTDHLP